MSIYAKLHSLGIKLALIPSRMAAFVPYVRSGNLFFVSGRIVKSEGKPEICKLRSHLSRQGKDAARSVAIDLIGTLHQAAGDLGKIQRTLKMTVLINSDASFTEHHLLANGASELMDEIFGNRATREGTYGADSLRHAPV
jgi:enamine deaminase RidA (YjgF/YER057c/UK114 family)